GLVTTITTDPNGVVTTQRTEGGLLTSVESKTAKGKTATRFEYDGLGRRIRTHDPRTGESKTAYDPETGHVAAEIDHEGRATRYAHYPADHPSAGRLAAVADAAGKEQHIAYTPRGEQRAVWGENTQPLLFEYNDYGERVGMRTFQTTPEGDPSHVEATGAKTAWRYDEATGSLLRKEYADGHGPVYAYTEAGQLESRTWARDSRLAVSDLAVSQNQESKTAKGKMATSYSYDAKTFQLVKSTATDSTEVTYEYDSEGRLTTVAGGGGGGRGGAWSTVAVTQEAEVTRLIRFGPRSAGARGGGHFRRAPPRGVIFLSARFFVVGGGGCQAFFDAGRNARAPLSRRDFVGVGGPAGHPQAPSFSPNTNAGLREGAKKAPLLGVEGGKDRRGSSVGSPETGRFPVAKDFRSSDPAKDHGVRDARSQLAVDWMRMRVLDSILPPLAGLMVSTRISSTIQTSPNFLPWSTSKRRIGRPSRL
ncbi:MAG: hypothetical protein GXX91_01155, partial [Verrucomicrobiaceae bacterium]|nr:hypothetical protein [Verrucomicrobiaceae bacterium]